MLPFTDILCHSSNHFLSQATGSLIASGVRFGSVSSTQSDGGGGWHLPHLLRLRPPMFRSLSQMCRLYSPLYTGASEPLATTAWSNFPDLPTQLLTLLVDTLVWGPQPLLERSEFSAATSMHTPAWGHFQHQPMAPTARLLSPRIKPDRRRPAFQAHTELPLYSCPSRRGGDRVGLQVAGLAGLLGGVEGAATSLGRWTSSQTSDA